MAEKWLSVRKIAGKTPIASNATSAAKSTKKTANGANPVVKAPPKKRSVTSPAAAARKRKAPASEDSDEAIDVRPPKKTAPLRKKTPPAEMTSSRKKTPPVGTASSRKKTPPARKTSPAKTPPRRSQPVESDDDEVQAAPARKGASQYRAPTVEEVEDDNATLLQVLEDLDPRAKYITRIHCDYEHVYQLARYMPRCLGPFTKVERAFVRGGYLDAREGFRESLEPGKVWDDDVAFCRGYDILEEEFPMLIEAQPYLRAHPDQAVKVLDFIDKVGARARGDDLSRLRHRVIEYIDPEAVDTLKVKANRGFRNTMTGRLLCPVSKLAKFDADPSAFCREVRDGKIQLHSLDWPLLLYDEDLMQPGKVRPGLLRSELLVRAFLTVYRGPQAADRLLRDSSRSTGKPSLAVKYNITEVTFEAIFYVVALVRSLLTARASWAIKDGAYNGKDFIYSLCRAMSSDTPFMKSLLAWWNKQIFGILDKEQNSNPEFAANLFDLEAGDEYQEAFEADDQEELEYLDAPEDDDEDQGIQAAVTNNALAQFEAEAEDEEDASGEHGAAPPVSTRASTPA